MDVSNNDLIMIKYNKNAEHFNTKFKSLEARKKARAFISNKPFKHKHQPITCKIFIG